LSAPYYLVIGHITFDISGDGFAIGGTATYAAVTAARLGWSVRILTSCDPEGYGVLQQVADGASIACVQSGATTRFSNVYTATGRKQKILSVAAPLSPQDLPPEWRHSDVVHVGPVAEETDIAFIDGFSDETTLGITPQGWLRTWDSDGAVVPERWMPEPESLAATDAIVLSQDDVGPHRDLIEYYCRHCPITVVTEGYRGSTVYLGQEPVRLTTRPAREIDPTGAGDVFAAAFFIRLRETGDPLTAAQFANVAGSFSVESPGISAIPTRETIESWLASNPGSHGTR